MASLSMLMNPAGYHLLAFGTLFGTQIHQTFLVGTAGYKALPRPAFRELQNALFPPYFAMQSVLPVVLAATYPGGRGVPASVYGVMAPGNAATVLVPLVVMLGTGLANALFVGPWTTKVMYQRVEQEKKDGKKCNEPGPHSEEMQQLNSQFGRMHGISTLLNLGALCASAWYAFGLAERIL